MSAPDAEAARRRARAGVCAAALLALSGLWMALAWAIGPAAVLATVFLLAGVAAVAAAFPARWWA